VSGDVKGRRRYDSPRRREQAAATRLAILEAAELLFREYGYTATTVPAIASEAGVAVKTVYLAVGSKSDAVHALWDLRLKGDDDPLPVPARPWYRELLDEEDPRRLLQQLADQSALVKQRAGSVMEIVRDAARVDAGVADLWHRIQTEFHGVLHPVAERLVQLEALADHLDAATATDILWALNHPDVWQLLSAQRGWTVEHYRSWLAGLLCDHLLRPVARKRRTPP
jgi:TetR/AcrR family transcriptional regulator of autoinduction and epiphytic fitness